MDLLKSLREKDTQTYLHCSRVSREAQRIAVQLGHSSDIQDLARIIGLFHDVEKIVWPSYLFAKRDLDESDYAIIRRHPEIGACIAGQPKQVLAGIRDHHKYQDNPYPDKPTSDDGLVRIATQIVAAADKVDVCTHKRTYQDRKISWQEVACSYTGREEFFEEALRSIR